MKVKREVKIGIVVALGLGLLYYGLFFLKGINVFKKQNTFYAVYEKVDGLAKENPVLINGLKVGQVNDMYFSEDNSGRIVVKFFVDEGIRVPKNTIAMLYSTDLIGSKALDLRIGDSDTIVVTGDTLETDREQSLTEQVSVQMLPVKRKAENLMLSIDSVLAVIKYVLNEKTRENISKSFENIKNTFQNLENTTSNIDTLITYQRSRMAGIFSNIESITYNIRKNNQKLSNILSNVSNITDSISQSEIASTIANTNKSLENLSDILVKVNESQGSLGLLVNDDSLYRNLGASSKELELLLEDLRVNPERYLHFSVFGGGKSKKDKKNKTDK